VPHGGHFAAMEQPDALAHLKRLRVDLVKIDGSIVRKLLSGNGARNILDAILRIARTLNIGVIGSCVEHVCPRLASLVCEYFVKFEQALIADPRFRDGDQFRDSRI